MPDSTKWVDIEIPSQPEGLRIVTRHPCRVVAFPREALSKVRGYAEIAPHPLERQGVYVLRGPRGERESLGLYVGRAEPRPVGQRLKVHEADTEKMFWRETYVITISAENERVPAAYVEARLIRALKVLGREGDNRKNENGPELTPRERSDAEDFFDKTILCLRALGVFDFGTGEDNRDDGSAGGSKSTPSPRKRGDSDAPDNAELRLTSREDVHAYAREPHTGNFIVLPDSTIRADADVGPDFRNDYPDLMRLREDLIEADIIKETNGKLKFQKEHSFDSRLTAKRIILGNQGRGRGNSWQDLDEIDE